MGVGIGIRGVYSNQELDMKVGNHIFISLARILRRRHYGKRPINENDYGTCQ